MNTETKNNQLIDLCKKLKYNQNIVFSDEGNLNVPSDVSKDKQRSYAYSKPKGLWYSCGPVWIEYLTDDYKDQGQTWEKKRLAGMTHVYSLRLRRKFIYSIETEKEFDIFAKRYARKDNQAVYWDKLDADGWKGIEIDWIPERDKGWYDGWDCSSGCLWHPKAVKSIKLLLAWDYHFKKI